jgi:hypothetical protein
MKALAIFACVSSFVWLQSCNLFKSNSSNSITSESSTNQEQTSDACTVKKPNAAFRLQGETNDLAAQAQSVGMLIIGDLRENLVVGGITPAAANFIADKADASMIEAINSLIIDPDSTKSFPINVVAGPLVQGSFFALTDSCAGMTDSVNRITTSKSIMASVVISLKDTTTDMTPSDISRTVNAISATATRSIPQAGLNDNGIGLAIDAITTGVVGAFGKAGFSSSMTATVSREMAVGIVSSIDEAGASKNDVTAIAELVSQSAIKGLTGTGLTAQEIADSGVVGNIVSGIVAGLSQTNIDSSMMSTAIGTVAAASIEVFDDVGLNVPALRQAAIGDVISGSIAGAIEAKVENSEMGSVLNEVAKQVVSSLADGGIPASEIADATATVIKAGISEIMAIGSQNSSSANDLAAKIMEGAIAGAIALQAEEASFTIESIVQSVTTSAVDALVALQDQGLFQNSSEVIAFTSSISTSISTGLSNANVSAIDIQAAVYQSNAVLESDAVSTKANNKLSASRAIVNLVWADSLTTWPKTLVGFYTQRVLTVSNTGAAVATSFAVSLPTSRFSIASNTCGVSLAAAAECSVTVRFTPTGVQSQSQDLSIAYNDGSESIVRKKNASAQAVDFTVTGNGDFGGPIIGTTVTRSFVITNISIDKITVTPASLSAPFAIGSANCDNVAAQETCSISVEYSPIASGSSNAQLTINLGSFQKTVALSGTGNVAAILAFDSPDQSTYQSVILNSNRDITFTVTNSGSVDATQIGTLSLPSGFSSVSSTCSSNLAASASCQYVVRFTPNAVQAYSGNLSVQYNNGAQTVSVTKALSASGTEIVVDPIYHSFSNWLDFSEKGSSVVCPSSLGYCDHGGEFKKVSMPNYHSCTGMTMTDALGWFEWNCVFVSGYVEFQAKRLKLSVRLEDLIQFNSSAPHAWKNNSVTAKLNGTSVATSWPTKWWSNPITDLPAMVSTGANDLASAGTIYVVRDNADTHGLTISADRQAVIVLRGKALRWVSGGDIPPSILVDSAASNAKQVWIEGDFDGNGVGTGFEVGTDPSGAGDNWIFRNFSLANTVSYGIRLWGDGHRFENVAVTNNQSSSGICSGLNVNDTHNFFYNLRVTNHANIAINIGHTSTDNRFINVISANARGGLTFADANSVRNTISNAIVTNIASGPRPAAVEMHWGANNNTFDNFMLMNNTSKGLNISQYGSSNGNSFNQTFASDNNQTLEFNAAQNANTFGYNFMVKATETCSVFTNSGANPNNTNLEATPTSGQYPCAKKSGDASNLNVISAPDYSNSFVGYLGNDGDTTNTAEDGNASVASASISGLNWSRFDNIYRTWSVDQSSFPNSGNVGRCSGTCKIFDWRLKSSDTVFLNRTSLGTNSEITGDSVGDDDGVCELAEACRATSVNGQTCPLAVHGDMVATTYIDNTNSKFLINAQEIIDDAIGDNDGLCESFEACIYSPNFGVYQGSGDYKTVKCNFQDSAGSGVTNVEIYAYPNNGI